MKLVRPADRRALERLMEDLRSLQPTYADVGATLTGHLPDGCRHDHYATSLGHESETFARGVRGLQTWKAHRQRAIKVFPPETEVRSGATVIVTLGTNRISLAAPCRIVGVIEEPRRWGFAYGTLPGHPEQGEEAFCVSISDQGEVRFDITAFSRPGDPIVRLSGPIGRRVQRIGTHGYLRALRRFVAEGS
jgi:uncharacterized protein (UPF0548 family)